MIVEEYNFLREKCSRLQELLDKQSQQNYLIKIQNIQLENRIKELNSKTQTLEKTNANFNQLNEDIEGFIKSCEQSSFDDNDIRILLINSLNLLKAVIKYD